ncbi:MAG: hypothetical protein ACRCXX_14050 [Cetobacterium sp.]|uniref:hypothetical protein n=1 Tax=Cetobacterium sp. TaxID=2071632 RepID=UPI003F3F81C4
MPVIKKMNKRMKKEKEDEIAGRLIAIKQLINHQVTKTFQTLITIQFMEIKNKYEQLTYESLDYLVRKLTIGIQEEGQEELFEALAAINYSQGEGQGVEISKEGLDNFVELAKGYVTVDRCLEILETYNKSSDHLGTLLEATKIANERATGEEFDIISE